MKKIVIPSVLALIGLGILLSLGTWQVQRHEWKQGLLAQIKEGMSKTSVAYESWLGQAEGERLEQFARVTLNGRFLTDQVLYVHSIQGGVLGNLVFVPFQLAEGKVVFVNRGFVPYHLTGQENKVDGEVDVALSGVIRLPETPKAFTPPPEKKRKYWYVADIKDMGDATGIKGLETGHYIEAGVGGGGPTVKGQWPTQRTPDDLIKSIPNKHFGYAITWFGLAGALLLVFVAYIWSVRRKS